MSLFFLLHGKRKRSILVRRGCEGCEIELVCIMTVCQYTHGDFRGKQRPKSAPEIYSMTCPKRVLLGLDSSCLGGCAALRCCSNPEGISSPLSLVVCAAAESNGYVKEV